VPLSNFASHKLRRSGLVLGYSAYNRKMIHEAAQRLCEACVRSETTCLKRGTIVNVPTFALHPHSPTTVAR
jgi:hypothetical protein